MAQVAVHFVGHLILVKALVVSALRSLSHSPASLGRISVIPVVAEHPLGETITASACDA